MVIADMGPAPKAVYVGRGFTVALLGGSYWADEVQIEDWSGRKCDPVYVSWLRQHAARYPEEASEFARLLREYMPELCGTKVEVPFWYRGPELDREVYWDDAEQQRVREASQKRTPELAAWKRWVLHGMRGPREDHSNQEAGDPRDRAKKPGARKMVAPVQRTFAMPEVSRKDVFDHGA